MNPLIPGGNSAPPGHAPKAAVGVPLYDFGSALEGTKSAPSSFTMPAFGWRLSDQEVADVSTFVRASWGNAGAPVSAEDVATTLAPDT